VLPRWSIATTSIPRSRRRRVGPPSRVRPHSFEQGVQRHAPTRGSRRACRGAFPHDGDRQCGFFVPEAAHFGAQGVAPAAYDIGNRLRRLLLSRSPMSSNSLGGVGRFIPVLPRYTNNTLGIHFWVAHGCSPDKWGNVLAMKIDAFAAGIRTSLSRAGHRRRVLPGRDRAGTDQKKKGKLTGETVKRRRRQPARGSLSRSSRPLPTCRGFSRRATLVPKSRGQLVRILNRAARTAMLHAERSVSGGFSFSHPCPVLPTSTFLFLRHRFCFLLRAPCPFTSHADWFFLHSLLTSGRGP